MCWDYVEVKRHHLHIDVLFGLISIIKHSLCSGVIRVVKIKYHLYIYILVHQA
jgi:hypothetical protein